MVLVQPRVRMPRALETPPLSYDPAHCLLYMACRYTRQKRLFDITDCIPHPPSSYERCRSEKGTVLASASPIDECGHEETASFIVLFATTNRNPLSHRFCNKQSFLTDHTPFRRLFGIVHVEMNHT